MTHTTEPTIDRNIDSILEELHNSWIEDDYEFDDPCGIYAKNAIKALISDQVAKARIETLQWALNDYNMPDTDTKANLEVYIAELRSTQ